MAISHLAPNDHKITFVLNDILDKKDAEHKPSKIIADLKKYLYLEGPIFFSENRLLTISGDGNKHADYLLEMYKVKNSNQLVLLEFLGNLSNFSLLIPKNTSKQLSKPILSEHWHHLNITLLPKNHHLKKIVEEILRKY